MLVMQPAVRYDGQVKKSVQAIEPVILELLAKRGAGKTICPSEVAREMAARAGTPESWRAWMDRTRETASGMADRGLLVILQRGQRVDPDTVRGPIRFGLP